MAYKSEDIIDLKKISQLLESYTKATGLVSALLDLEGNILSQSGWQKICTQFHRINPETAKNCCISDTILSAQLQEGHKYTVYKCLNGLVDVAVPIVVNDKHMYNLFTGQFFIETPQEDYFIAQAHKYNFDQKEYMDAFRQVPILKESEIENKLLFLSQMTEMIVDLGLAKLESFKINIALKESEEKFKALYDNAPLSYQSLDEDGSFRDVNPKWLSTLGYERNEVIGHFYKDFLHPDWQDHFEDNFPKFKKRGYVNDVQFRIRHKKGHYLDISFEGCIGYHPDGSFKQTYCVFTDITERKKVEQEILESEERFRNAITYAPYPIMMHADGKVLQLSDEWIKQSGYTIDDIPTIQEWSSIAYGKEAVPSREFIENLYKIDKPQYDGEWKVKIKNGRERYWDFSSSPIGVLGNGDKMVISMASDITARKEAEQAISLSNGRYKSLFDDSPIPLWEEDLTDVFFYLSETKGIGNIDLRLFFKNNPDELLKCSRMIRVLDVNQAALDLHLASSKDQLIENIHKVFTSKSLMTFLEEIISLSEGKKTFKSECEIKTLSGELRHIDLTLNVHQSQTDRIKVLLATSDITERKHATENYKNTFDLSPSIISKANITKGYFVEVNEAVTKILGYTVDEFMAIPFMEMIHPEDRHEAADELTEQLTGKEVISFENRYLCKDGSYKWIAWNGTKADEYGIVTAIGSDVTDRKMAEKELTQHRENLEELVKERTKNLEEKNTELEKFNDLFVDREFRIKELRDEINELTKDVSS